MWPISASCFLPRAFRRRLSIFIVVLGGFCSYFFAFRIIQAATTIPSAWTEELSTLSPNVTMMTQEKMVTNASLPRILLFITTHFSNLHIDFFRECWPSSIAKSILLQTADVAVFSTGPTNFSLLQATFPTQNVSVYERSNPGYQSGAMLALQEAARNKWFDGYDWVIRLNPDVIIRNDTWIWATMRDTNIDAIFVNCRGINQETLPFKIHTDFFAIRPARLPNGTFLNYIFRNAEEQMTLDMQSILQSERYRWLADGGPKRPGYCRVHRENSPVIHYHEYLTECKNNLADTITTSYR